MNKCIVVIPIYKKELTETEISSLKQCFEVLNNHPIAFVCSETLDASFYEKFAKSKNKEVSFERFADRYFESMVAYSKMLLKKEFYEKFSQYEFMLIYQLDAWVFEDKLEHWCEQGYDYIGAPWFEEFDLATEDSPMLPIAGNGGFSLRKISTMITMLGTSYKAPKSLKQIYIESSKRKLISKIINIPIYIYRYIFQMAHFFKFWDITTLYEDIAIARHANKAYNDFKLAPPEIALKFSFEVQPRRLYQMNNQELPFGCHAFEKYDFEFWNQFIKKRINSIN